MGMSLTLSRSHGASTWGVCLCGPDDAAAETGVVHSPECPRGTEPRACAGGLACLVWIPPSTRRPGQWAVCPRGWWRGRVTGRRSLSGGGGGGGGSAQAQAGAPRRPSPGGGAVWGREPCAEGSLSVGNFSDWSPGHGRSGLAVAAARHLPAQPGVSVTLRGSCPCLGAADDITTVGGSSDRALVK